MIRKRSDLTRIIVVNGPLYYVMRSHQQIRECFIGMVSYIPHDKGMFYQHGVLYSPMIRGVLSAWRPIFPTIRGCFISMASYIPHDKGMFYQHGVLYSPMIRGCFISMASYIPHDKGMFYQNDVLYSL